MTKKHSLFSATGIPSLFLIFAVLMLVILALLGYGTSRQDLQSSTLSLEQTTAYYTVCSQAADFYTDTAAALRQFKKQAKNAEEYQQLITDYFNGLKNVSWDPTASKVSYINPFSNVQSLLVILLVENFSDTSENPTEILTWNTIVTADWNPDTSQSVYKGESLWKKK